MGKLTTYVLLMTGLVVLFYFTGLLTVCNDEGSCSGATPSSNLLDFALNPQNLKETNFFEKAIITIGLAIAAGVAALATIFGKGELVIMGGMTIYITGLLWDFMFVFSRVYSENPVFAVILFGPLLVLFVITMIEWWRGRD